MGISDWSSDVCSSYLLACDARRLHRHDGLFGDDRAVTEGRPLARLAAVDQDDAPAVTQQAESAANADDARPADHHRVLPAPSPEERAKIREALRNRPGLPRRSDWAPRSALPGPGGLPAHPTTGDVNGGA